MSNVYLALRTSAPDGILQRIFYAITKWRLHTKYPHGGIVCNDDLYHCNLSNGLHKVKFDSDGWQLYSISVTEEEVEQLYEKYKYAKYDWFSLLGFLLPWRVTKIGWLYCFEWCYIVMTGEDAMGRVTPEMLLDLAHEMRSKQRRLL